MKKLVRGPFGRVLCAIVLVSMMVPSLLLPSATRGHAAVDSGRRTVLLLPVSLTAEGAPPTLALTAMDRLKAALEARPGVSVLVLSRNSGTLTRAKNRLADEASQKSLLEHFDTATNPKASDEERMNAAAVLAAALGVDYAVYGELYGYKMSNNGRVREVLMSASAVTIDRDADGNPLIDGNGAIRPHRTPITAKGRSRDLPGPVAASAMMDQEALAEAADNLASRITGIQLEQPTTADGRRTISGEEKKKSGMSGWVLPALLVVVAGAALSGGGGGGGTPPPVTPITYDPPVSLIISMETSGGLPAMRVSWSMPPGSAIPVRFDIYRYTTGSASIAPASRSALVTGPNSIKSPYGRVQTTTRSTRGSQQFRDLHSSRRPQPLAAEMGDGPYHTITVGSALYDRYSFVDNDVQYGQTYTYVVVAVYKNGGTAQAIEVKSLPNLTPEVQNPLAANDYGNVELTWTAPANVTNGGFYRVFRTTTAIPVGKTTISADERSSFGFTDISPANGIPWGTDAFTDDKAVKNVENSYIIVWYDTTGKPSSGPYTLTRITPVEIVKVLTLDVRSEKQINVTWIATGPGKPKYELQRTRTPNLSFSWTTIEETDDTKYDDKDNLLPGTRYYYRLRQQSLTGWQIVGDIESAMTFPAAPEFTQPPRSISHNEVELYWTLVTGATHYIVQRADGASTIFNTVEILSASNLYMPYIDNTAIAGQQAKYRVIASNDLNHLGEKDLPGTANKEATVTSAPAPVTDLSISKAYENQLDLIWVAVPGGTGAAVTYRIERTDDPLDWPIIPLVASQTGTTYADKGLISSTQYYYRITSMNASGNTVSQVFGPFTTYPKPAQIIVPIEVLSATSVKLNWLTIPRATKYTVQRKLLADDYFVDAGVITTDGTGGLPLSFTDSPLLSGTMYVYRIVSSSLPSGQGSLSAEVAVQLPMDPNPSYFTFSVQSKDQINVAWIAEPGATNYQLQRTTTPEVGTSWQTVATQTGLTFQNQNLTPGTTYTYRLLGQKSGTWVYLGRNDSATTFPDAPLFVNPPTPIDYTQVDLRWNLVPSATYYIVQRADGTGTYQNVETLPAPAGGTTMSYSDMTVVPGASSKYRVIASNNLSIIGSGGLNGTANTEATILNFPAPVTNFNTTSVTDTALGLAWTAVGGTGVTYKIEATTDLTNWPLTPVVASQAGATYNHTALVSATQYWYRISAMNATGSTVSEIFGPYMTKPKTVQIQKLTAISSSAVKVEWITTRGATSYSIIYRLKSDDQWSDPIKINADGTPLLLMEHTVNNLLPQTTYVFRLITSNVPTGEGTSSAEVEVTTAAPVPAAPVQKPIVIASQNALNLSWEAVPTATSYIVEHTTDPSNWPATPLVKDLTGLTYSHTGLVKGSLHYYRISAVNTGGTSAPSNVESKRTFPGISVLTATMQGETVIRLSWTKVANTENYIIEKFDPELNTWDIFRTIPGTPEVLTVDDTTCSAGYTYQYRITASVSDVIADGQTSTPAVSVSTKLTQPSITKIEALSDTEISLEWDAVNGATGYKVEFSLTSNGPWSVVPPAMITGTTCLHTGRSASTKYYYRVSAVKAGMDYATSDPSEIKDATTLAGPKVAAYNVEIAAGKKSRLYFSNDSADELALFAETTTELIITGYKNTGKTLPAVAAEVTLITRKGVFSPMAVGQTVGNNGKTITGILDGNGQMRVVFMGRPETDRTTFLMPDPITELGPVTFDGSSYNEPPIAMDFKTPAAANQPMLIGPPATISLTTVVPTPLAPQPNEGMQVIFQRDNMSVTATVVDALGNPVMRGTPLWFTQSWTKLADVNAISDPLYNRKAVGCGNYSNPSVTQTMDDTGKVTLGFSSNHSGVYKVRVFATRAARTLDTSKLDPVNTDATPGGLATPIPTAVKDNLLLDGVGNPVEAASVDVLCKTYVHLDRWTKVGTAGVPSRINCNGDDSATITFTARDFDGKRVLPGTYYKVWPMIFDRLINQIRPCGELQDKNSGQKIDGILRTFDENSQASMLVRGTRETGKLVVRFDSMAADMNEYYYLNEDLVTWYGPDPFIARDHTSFAPWYAIIASDERIASSLNKGTAELKKSSTLTVRLVDTNGNKFPAGYLVTLSSTAGGRVSGTKAITLSSAQGQTNKDGECVFSYVGPDLSSSVNRINDMLELTVDGITNNSDSVVRGPTQWLRQVTISTEQPHSGTIEPVSAGAGSIVLPFNSQLLIRSYVSRENPSTLPDTTPKPIQGYTIDIDLQKSVPGINATLTPPSWTTPGGGGPGATLLTTTLNTGTVYGTVRVRPYFDKNNSNNIQVATEMLGDTGDIIIGLPTPVGVTVRTLDSELAGTPPAMRGRLQINWTDGNYENGYLIERSENGTTWTVIDPDGDGRTVTTDVTTFTDTNLDRGKEYQYRVTAVRINNGDYGTVSSVVSAVAKGTTAPPPPTNFAGTTPNATTVNLTWTAAPAVTGYQIGRRQATFPLTPSGAYTQIAAPGVVATYSDANVPPNTNYQYQIRSVMTNANGTFYSEYVESGVFTTPPSVGTPYQHPITLSETNQPVITWNAVTGTNITYRVMRGTALNAITTQVVDNFNGTLYKDNSVTANGTYYYQVFAKDAAGNLGQGSNVQSIVVAGGVVTVPATPTGLASADVTSTTITMQWNASAGATSYIIQQINQLGVTSSVETANTNYQFTGLTPGMPHRYRVSAKNAAGTSAQSAEVIVNTLP